MARRRQADADISAEALKLDLPADVTPSVVVAEEVHETTDESSANTDALLAQAAAPAEPKKRHQIPDEDIGNWKFTPWHGRAMWTHKSGSTSFIREHVSRHRNQ